MSKKSKAPLFVVLLLCAGLFGPACRKAETPPWVKQHTLVEASDVGPSFYPLFTKWLARHAETPLDFIVRECRAHQVVIIGEHHYIRNYLELVKQAIPEAYHKAGVRVLALEACNAEDNEKLSRLVEGPAYDKDLAYDIARNQNWGLWGYKEYWDLLEAVWQLNKNLPSGRDHMRVIGIDKQMDYQLDSLWRGSLLKDPVLVEKAKNQPDIYKRDDWLAENIEKEIIAKGARGMILIGLNHSFTHYAQPKLNKELKLEREWPRTANTLHQKYGDKIFQIGFHGPYMSPSQIDRTYKGPEPLMADLLEKILTAAGGKSVAFEAAGSPFADVRDGRSYYFHWQPKAKFADIYQSFVFLKPAKELSLCVWMEGFISDAMFEKSKLYYETTYGRKFKDSREVNEFFKAGSGSL